MNDHGHNRLRESKMKNIWNELIHQLPDPHLLQTWQWGEVKSEFGWRPQPLLWIRRKGNLELVKGEEILDVDEKPAAAALLLHRRLPFGFHVMYVPKGPLLEDWSDPSLRLQVVRDLQRLAEEGRGIFLKMDPDVIVGKGVPGEEDAETFPLGDTVQEELRERGWVFSPDQIQYRNTVLVDLTASEEDILMRMKSKTRYNIRLAGRKGVTVRRGDRSDLDLLYRMYAKTSVRGGFTIRSEEYYQTVWDLFLPAESKGEHDPVAVPFIAEVEGETVAAIVMFCFADRAWYLHGMSTEEHREKMPTYVVQWEGMRWAKDMGCTVYDMWGAPDRFEREDPMWGVYRFKRGFGGRVTRTIGAWDYPVKPVLYKMYTALLPRLLAVMREIGDRQTEEAASE